MNAAASMTAPSNRFSALVPQFLENLGFRDRLAANALVVASGVALLALSSQLSIRLPFTPVPFTAQTFAVLLIGASFGSARGILATAIYLALGVSGLPVFAAGAELATSAGFLLGFLAAAGLMGWVSERGYDRDVRTALPLFLLGELVIFAFGVAWLSTLFGFKAAVGFGLLPFIPGEIAKVVAASFALPGARRALRLG